MSDIYNNQSDINEVMNIFSQQSPALEYNLRRAQPVIRVTYTCPQHLSPQHSAYFHSVNRVGQF